MSKPWISKSLRPAVPAAVRSAARSSRVFRVAKVGGHPAIAEARRALQRAARLGDGWVSANTDFATLKTLLADLAALRTAAGTAGRRDFEIHGFDMAAQSVADFQRLGDLGVTDACVAPWGFDPAAPLSTQLDGLRRFGDSVIARM